LLGSADHVIEPLDEAEEGRHEPGDDFFWNESWYFDFFASDASIGGYVRFGMYPNWDRRTWHTAYVVTPGRPSVAVVDYAAPIPAGRELSIETPAFEASLQCAEPSRRWHLEMQGTGRASAEPTALYAPDAGTPTPVSWSLDWTTEGEPYRYPASTGLTRYEVPVTVSGEVVVDGQRFHVEGGGQRDHSWGPRGGWWSYEWCWLGFSLEDGTKVHANDVRKLSGEPIFGTGYVQPPGGFERLAGVEVRADRGPDDLPTEAVAELKLESSSLEVSIDMLAWGNLALPGPKGQVSHFQRALARFTTDDGRTGLGWAEWNRPQAAASQEPTPR
jgi:hypothetical protein